MKNKLVVFISYLFHPLLMPSWGIFIIFIIKYNLFLNIKNITSLFFYIFFIVFILTFVLPVVMLIIFYKNKIISNLNIPLKKERIIPIFFTFIIYFFTYYTFNKIQFAGLITIFILISTIMVGVSLLTTIFYKISIHAISISGLVTTTYFYTKYSSFQNVIIILILILISGLVGYARIKIQAHKILEVILGFVVGIIIPIVLFVFLFNL